MLRLLRLRLHNFRNYPRLSLDLPDGEPGRVVVVSGPNGGGKTNLLEAISLLVPGRGLRGARPQELPRQSPGAPGAAWGVGGWLQTDAGMLEVATGIQPETSDRRVFRIDGATLRNHTDLARRLAMVWLTPQMDMLFQEPPSGRRRFLDRLVIALDPTHAQQLAAHDTAQAERMRLLLDGRADPAWLAAVEESIARHAVAATAARRSLVRRIRQTAANEAVAGFPPAVIALACPIADRLETGAALDAEDWLRAMLAHARTADASAGSSSFGAQRADMTLADAATSRTADLASTGQRKAMLIGVILQHAAMVGALRGEAPILLLDEPMVHLDADRRRQLRASIAVGPAQVFLTGVDPDSLIDPRHTATLLKVDDGRLQPDRP